MSIDWPDILVATIISIPVSILVNLFVEKFKYKSISSFYHENTESFVYIELNGFGFNRFYKRLISGGAKTVIKKDYFNQIKPDLVQRGIDI